MKLVWFYSTFQPNPQSDLSKLTMQTILHLTIWNPPSIWTLSLPLLESKIFMKKLNTTILESTLKLMAMEQSSSIKTTSKNLKLCSRLNNFCWMLLLWMKNPKLKKNLKSISDFWNSISAPADWATPQLEMQSAVSSSSNSLFSTSRKITAMSWPCTKTWKAWHQKSRWKQRKTWKWQTSKTKWWNPRDSKRQSSR